METLKLETNIPVEVAFKFVTGKDCESQYSGPQKLFTVTLPDGETKPLYLSAGAGERVEKLLAEQNVRAGEFVDLCKAEVKNGNRKGIEYQVKRVSPPQNGNGASARPPAPSQPAHDEQAQSNVSPNGSAANGAAPVNGNDRPKTKLEDALCTVAAALLAAEKYAKAIGYEAWPKQFTGDEVVRLANTICINSERANGGAR